MRWREFLESGYGSLLEALFLSRKTRREYLTEREGLKSFGSLRFFSREEAESFELIAAIVVPSDDESPGIVDLPTLGEPATTRIDAWIASSKARKTLYARGLLAFEELATKRYSKAFTLLSVEEQKKLIDCVGMKYQAHTDPGSGSLLTKVVRKALHAYGMWLGWAPAVDLWPVLRSDCLKAFYTSEVSWLWLDYDGPPMPNGYVNPTKKRERASTPQLPLPAPPRSLERAQEVDVVVIGCGAGGAVVAKELTEAGVSVVVLEAGKRYLPLADYVSDRTDFEVSAHDTFDADDERRDLYTTAMSGGFSYNRVKGVGGSTLHYAAMSPRLHESDFRTFSEDGVGANWPISYADLEPYYSRVEYELGVSGPIGAEANPFEPPRSRPYPTPPHPFNLAGLRIKRGADQLGLHLVREPLALPSRDWGGRPACVGAGTCHIGCLISAKSSMDVTYVRKAEATGRVDVRAESMAVEIELNSSGRASGVVYIDKAGARHRVKARAVVLAGNAVETSRLLLLNSTPSFPQGLANSSGQVGRNFFEHLAVFAHGLFEERLDPWRGTPTSGFLQDHYATRAQNGFARGWTTLVTASSHWPYAVARRLPGWGAAHKENMIRHFGYQACVGSIGEQLAMESNRVDLDPIQKDIYGLPVPRLTNNLCANDKAMIKAISTSLSELLQASGAVAITRNEHVPGMSSHYLGTCRMGEDPSRSVVDSWGRTHDVPNLFIADSSILVSGGAVNPALTISALATRTAERIISSLARKEL